GGGAGPLAGRRASRGEGRAAAPARPHTRRGPDRGCRDPWLNRPDGRRREDQDPPRGRGAGRACPAAARAGRYVGARPHGRPPPPPLGRSPERVVWPGPGRGVGMCGPPGGENPVMHEPAWHLPSSSPENPPTPGPASGALHDRPGGPAHDVVFTADFASTRQWVAGRSWA